MQEKLICQLGDDLWLVELGHMSGVFQHHNIGVRHLIGQLKTTRWGSKGVLLPPDEESPRRRVLAR